MKIPTRKQADAYLEEAENLNPGLWVAHVRQAAIAAEILASHHPQLDPETAYVLGLLHDIGRREGFTDMRHVLDGYNFLIAEGFPDAARICLTHSFPIPNTGVGSGRWDCSSQELRFVQDFLDQVEFSPYDRLIQLCDSICLPSGPVLMEKRLMDVTLRHGFNDFTLHKFKAFIQIKNEFESEISRSIYSVLPGVVENTFDLKK